MNLTRQDALSAALYVYAQLAERVRAVVGDQGMRDGLYESWRAQLQSLNSFKSNPKLSDETNRAVAALTSAVARIPDDDPDALLRWLDAFPVAISELFPPSESTFSLQLDESAALGLAIEDEEFALVA